MALLKVDVLRTTAWAMERSAARAHLDLKRRLVYLATIASIAPFLGIFATLLQIADTLRGESGSRLTIYFFTMHWLSEALVPTALSLLVAVPASWSYRHFSNQAEIFKAEMKNTSLELLNCLARRQQMPS